jgi:hypothetical protein
MKKLVITVLLSALFLWPAWAQIEAAKNGIVVIEDFDGDIVMGADDSLWRGNAAIVRDETLGNGTPFVKFDVSDKGATELELLTLNVKAPSVFSFRYRPELIAKFGQTFKIYVDDELRTTLDGVDAGWRTERLNLPAGDHRVRFESANSKGVKVVGGYNAVYIDDIKIFPDVVFSIALRPRGGQDTYLNAAGSSKIRFKADALLPDGSVKEGAHDFIYSASGGTIDNDGVFTPDATGKFTVTAKLGNFSVQSGAITVHPADFIKLPYTYPGTGKTYQGYTGGERAKNAAKMPRRESFTITNPPVADFDADGFFLLEGTVNRPKGKNYARVAVRKVAPAAAGKTKAQKLETYYIVKDSFSRRIWLPFGEGEYRIELIEFDSASVTTPPQGEGMFRGGSYSQEPLAFTVYNTRSEDGVDGDGRWLYPSFNVESDDWRVGNLLNDITFGIDGERAKIKAIHDYLVSNLAYDTASFKNGARSRKMNAVSVIENGTGVCDGYTNLSAALIRAAGIPCKIISNKSIMHSWNNVFTGGAWKFYDATWDDPLPDRGPDIIQYDYFLLDSPSGGDSRHRGAGTAVIGDVE